MMENHYGNQCIVGYERHTRVPMVVYKNNIYGTTDIENVLNMTFFYNMVTVLMKEDN